MFTLVATQIVVSVPHRVPLTIAAIAIFLGLLILAIVTTRIRPVYGLTLLIVSDPFDFSHSLGPTTLTTSKMIILGVAIGLLLRRTSLAPLTDRRLIPLLGGAVAISVATMITAIPGVFIDAVLRESLKSLEYLALFIVAILASFAENDDRPLWYGLFGVVAVTSLLAIAQEFTTAPAAVMIHDHIVPRIAGPLEGPNQLAGFLDIAVPLLFARVVVTRDRFAIAVLSLAVLADVLTLSRAGFVGLLVGLVTVLLLLTSAKSRGPIALGVGITTAVIGGIFLKLGVLTRFFSASDIDTSGGLGSRGELWHAALAFWRANPLLGIGAGNFELDLPQAGLIDVRTHANSLYLQSLAEGGLILFGATVWTIVAAVRLCLIRAPREALFVGMGAATIALSVHQTLDFLTFFPKVGGFWWLWLGITSGAALRNEPVRSVKPTPLTIRGAATASVVLVIAIILLGHPHAKRISDISRLSKPLGPTWDVPKGVAYRSDVRGASLVDGLYPQINPNDVCCWLRTFARIPVRFPPDATYADLSLNVPAYSFFADVGQTLEIRIGSQHSSVSGLLPGFHRVAILLPTSGPRDVVEIRSMRAFNPSREGINADTRDLGIILRAVGYH